MPFLLKAEWRMKDVKFAEYKRRIHQASETAAVRLEGRMVRRAQEVAAERVLTGTMQRGIRGKVLLTERGVHVSLDDPVWYSHFQDRGTKRGVAPLLFLEAGLQEGREYAVPELAASSTHVLV